MLPVFVVFVVCGVPLRCFVVFVVVVVCRECPTAVQRVAYVSGRVLLCVCTCGVVLCVYVRMVLYVLSVCLYVCCGATPLPSRRRASSATACWCAETRFRLWRLALAAS